MSSIFQRRSKWPPFEFSGNPTVHWLILGLSVIAVLAVNPIGFIGGGWDDWQYLDAARCWRMHGPCLPYDHWQGRWPVIAPIASITGIFGESRTTVGIAPLITSLWCLVVFVFIGNRLFRPPVGFVAAGLLLCTAAFTIQILDPAVEAVELGFGLTGVMALLEWRRSGSVIWAALAGLSFGLAFQVRETALVAAGFAGLYVASRHFRVPVGQKVVAAGAFVLPLAIEMASFYAVTGDPLYRRRLSLKHTQIPSTELLGPIDRAHSPLFNPVYIANWRREPGVHIYWLIDGIINLFVNAKAGIALLIIPTLIFIYRKTLSKDVVRASLAIYGLSLIYMCALIYALALDPKARIMFFPIAALTLALALVLVRLHEAGYQRIARVAAGCSISVCLFIVFFHQRTYPIERRAAE